MRRISPLVFLFLPGVLGCPFFGNSSNTPFEDVSVTHRERDVSGKLAVALGGVAKGMDEFTIDEAMTVLELQNDDPDLFSIEPRDGFPDFTEGRGARVIPFEEGIGYVTPKVNAKSRDPIEVVIPPQTFIQILLGEARGELEREATLDEEEEVKTSSVSVTGDAVGAVIRNRIDLINEKNSPELFEADPEAYEQNPPISYYDSVIEANDGVNYQFSPVDPDDLSNNVYLAAEGRDDLKESFWTAYDQAVLTAAYIFNEDTEDPTGGAFGFYSPTSSEFEALKEALESRTRNLPDEAGTSDNRFPALAPVQVLILEEVAPSRADSEVPSFVFVRSRRSTEPAVIDEP